MQTLVCITPTCICPSKTESNSVDVRLQLMCFLHRSWSWNQDPKRYARLNLVSSKEKPKDNLRCRSGRSGTWFHFCGIYELLNRRPQTFRVVWCDLWRPSKPRWIGPTSGVDGGAALQWEIRTIGDQRYRSWERAQDRLTSWHQSKHFVKICKNHAIRKAAKPQVPYVCIKSADFYLHSQQAYIQICLKKICKKTIKKKKTSRIPKVPLLTYPPKSNLFPAWIEAWRKCRQRRGLGRTLSASSHQPILKGKVDDVEIWYGHVPAASLYVNEIN